MTFATKRFNWFNWSSPGLKVNFQIISGGLVNGVHIIFTIYLIKCSDAGLMSLVKICHAFIDMSYNIENKDVKAAVITHYDHRFFEILWRKLTALYMVRFWSAASQYKVSPNAFAWLQAGDGRRTGRAKVGFIQPPFTWLARYRESVGTVPAGTLKSNTITATLFIPVNRGVIMMFDLQM